MTHRPDDVLLDIVFSSLIELKRKSRIAETIYPAIITADIINSTQLKREDAEVKLEDVQRMIKDIIKVIV